MRTQLYIENIEIELDESTQFLLNKEFEHLSDPTKIITDWSKTVSIPFTEANNRTFGYFYKPEKVIISDGTADSYKRMQQYFDPTKKLDFKLVYNSAVLMTGYAKMNSIPMDKYKGTYNMTLFGQLGRVFQEMKKITFDTTTDDSTYLIDGSTYVDEVIDRNIVYASWTAAGQTTATLQPKYIDGAANPNYVVTDIIGFAPNNAYSEEFDYNTMQTSTITTTTFEEYFGDSFIEATGADVKTVIPNGLTPRGFGEFRSYQQLPFIYWNKLFQVFQKKAEAVTGYTFALDDSFFTTSNPYWYKLVYMLKPFANKPITQYVNNYNLMWGTDTLYWGSAAYDGNRSASVTPYVPIGGHYDEEIPIYYAVLIGSTSAMSFNTAEYSAHLDETFNLSFKYLTFYKDGTYRNTKLGTNNGFILKFSVTERKESGAEINQFSFFICSSEYTGVIPSVNEVINVDTVSTRSQSGGNDWSTIPFSVNVHLYIPPQSNANLKVTGRWYNSNMPLVQENGSPCSGTNPIYLPTFYLNNQTTSKKLVLANEKRSGDKFILNDLWNNDHNLFDEIIKYCKMMRIFIYTDDYAKKIHFVPYKKYFEYYTIEDWTDKLDRSKEMTLKPITFENKYVLFNYKDSDTELGKTYREKYGFDFGEYRLTTDYNFNTNTKELFDKIPTSIVNTDNTLSFLNLAAHAVVYSRPNEIFIYHKNKDQKATDTFGQFYFHNGLRGFSNDQSLKLTYPVAISDDTNLQKNYQRYFFIAGWSPGTNKVSCTTYPGLDVVYYTLMCLFNIPKENYTYNNDYAGKTTIYSKYWKNYIDERYSIQNRLITCYLRLTPKDWMNFRFSKFIKIDNILYMINKIYDYNIESTEATKVDLISITDITGYTS